MQRPDFGGDEAGDVFDCSQRRKSEHSVGVATEEKCQTNQPEGVCDGALDALVHQEKTGTQSEQHPPGTAEDDAGGDEAEREQGRNAGRETDGDTGGDPQNCEKRMAETDGDTAGER